MDIKVKCVRCETKDTSIHIFNFDHCWQRFPKCGIMINEDAMNLWQCVVWDRIATSYPLKTSIHASFPSYSALAVCLRKIPESARIYWSIHSETALECDYKAKVPLDCYRCRIFLLNFYQKSFVSWFWNPWQLSQKSQIRISMGLKMT